MVRLVVIAAIVLSLTVAVTATPVIPWLSKVFDFIQETPKPAPPVEPPQPSEPPPSALPPKPAENVTQGKLLVLTEPELQAKLNDFVARANQSGQAKIEYIRAKLEPGKMLVSAKGEALGYQGETQNLEVRFEGRKLFATGTVNAFGVSPTLVAEVEIRTEQGVPSVNVTEFKLGALPLTILGLSEAKISGIVNDAIKSRGLRLPVDVESIRIEEGKLMVAYR